MTLKLSPIITRTKPTDGKVVPWVQLYYCPLCTQTHPIWLRDQRTLTLDTFLWFETRRKKPVRNLAFFTPCHAHQSTRVRDIGHTEWQC